MGCGDIKIVDAVWEQRNLGVRAFEIQVYDNDNWGDFIVNEQLLIMKGAQYIVVKVPVNLPDYIWGLPSLKYTFVETGFQISLKKSKYTVPAFLARMDRSTKVIETTTDEEIEQTLLKYNENVFDSDRISIDPAFSLEISAKRYLLWTQDMLNEGCKLFNVFLSERNIGFFIVKAIDDHTAYPVLAALYSEFKDKGLGILLIKKCIETIWNLGYEKISSIIVSNNLNILKVDMALGFQIEDLHNVYVKHINQQT